MASASVLRTGRCVRVVPSRGVPSDGGPVCPPSCDDDVACTVDACEEGRCAHTADDGACADGERCNPVLGCVPIRCTSDPECDDGVFCNGVERCDGDAPGTGCVAGDPVVCDDGASCSADRCDEDADRCVATPDDSACADAVDCTVDRCDPAASSSPTGCVSTPNDAMCAGDFCTVGRRCNPTAGCVGGTDRDCRDGDPCTADSCDELGDMCISTLRDEDGDGFGAASVIAGGSVVMCGGPDCDDMNAVRNWRRRRSRCRRSALSASPSATSSGSVVARPASGAGPGHALPARG